MKKITSYIFAPLAAFLAVVAISVSCSKDEEEEVDNSIAKTYLDAWLSINHPGVSSTGRGIYVIEDTPGTGDVVTSDILQDHYVSVRFTAYDLDGTITSTTEEDVAKMIGEYTNSTYYGPIIWYTDPTIVPAGILDLLSGMKVGGTRKAIIPGWLTKAKDYSSAEKYFKYCQGSNAIYDVTLCGISDNIVDWEISQIEKYKVDNMADVDSAIYGVYTHTIIDPISDISFQKDTTIYVNYIGRLLNGNVFDTTIADTAKVYGIYSESSSYSPVKITMAEKYENVTMGSDQSTVVTGFAYGLWSLHPYEKLRCAFISNYGYSSTGSSPSIPAYAPLVFDLEVVDEPEE